MGKTVVSTVLVTGASERVAEMSSALRKAGAEVIAVDDLGKLDAALAGLPPGSLDRYIQMPVHVAARGETVVERVRHFLEDGLPARFAAASTILPAMSNEARVVLVGGNTSIGSASCRRIKSDKGVGLTGRGSLFGTSGCLAVASNTRVASQYETQCEPARGRRSHPGRVRPHLRSTVSFRGPTARDPPASSH